MEILNEIKNTERNEILVNRLGTRLCVNDLPYNNSLTIHKAVMWTKLALLGNMHRSFSKMFMNYAFGENRKLKNAIKGNKFGQLIAGSTVISRRLPLRTNDLLKAF